MIRPTVSIVLIALLLVAGFALGDEVAGHVEKFDGRVVAKDLLGRERVLGARSELNLGDTLVTGPGAKIQVRMIDDTVLSVGASSQLKLNTYVFDPVKKEANTCVMELAKGMCRVLTGKITKLNPERFKVKTRMATIGIRGSELAFVLQGNKLQVLTLKLGANKKVMLDVAGKLLAGPAQGNMATIAAGGQVVGGKIGAVLLKQVLLQTTPQGLGAAGAGVGAGAKATGAGAKATGLGGKVMGVGGKAAGAAKAAAANVGAIVGGAQGLALPVAAAGAVGGAAVAVDKALEDDKKDKPAPVSP